MTLSPNDIIDRKYKIERLLGRGGMGAVYVAEDLELARRVALKVLLPEAAANPEAVTRFEREARAAAALESDHVARIFGVGRLANGAAYIVMELLDGKDLSYVLAERGPLPVHEVVQAIIDACDALSEAHARGIIHRDLKPANLFFAKRANGNVTLKVLDFGISKTTSTEPGAHSRGLTGTCALIGTPSYMSPEQIREVRNVDARADIWALGVTMYELLIGSVPFLGEAFADLCVAVMLNAHRSITAQRPDVPPALEAIVDRCLAKEAGARFTSATELADALRALGTAPAMTRDARKPSVAPTALPAGSAQRDPKRSGPVNAPMTIMPVTTSHPPEWTPPETRTGVFVVGGIVMMLVIGAAGLFALRRTGDKSAAGTSADADADAGVGLVAAVVDAGVSHAASIAPLAPAPSQATAASPSPAKGVQRPPPRPQVTTKSGAVPDGPPPINFGRR
jgi:serine/threonine-protein kinase